MILFKHPEFDHHEEVIFSHDKDSGLKAIIAIHNTNVGPALGGCRVWTYPSESEALTDALRLSKGMTYKAAISNLKLGGGKSVILKDPDHDITEEQFLSFADQIEKLSGRYITAEDVGTSPDDIEIMRTRTKHVVGRRRETGEGSGDPSPITAHGVYKGMQAAVKQAMGRDSVEGLTVAVQGLGHVGYYLCKMLCDSGAKLVVTDIHAENVERVADECKAQTVDPDDIYGVDMDVFAPCALGAIINDETIPMLKAKVIAGAANNQLARPRHGKKLLDYGVLYAPDYLINAGELINTTYEGPDYDREVAIKHVDQIYDTAIEIFEMSDKLGMPTNVVADKLAEKRFKK